MFCCSGLKCWAGIPLFASRFARVLFVAALCRMALAVVGIFRGHSPDLVGYGGHSFLLSSSTATLVMTPEGIPEGKSACRD